MAKIDLTPHATSGYRASACGIDKCPFYASSPAAIAWHVGAWLQRTYRSAPRNVSMGRGYQVHANDMLLAWHDDNSITRIN